MIKISSILVSSVVVIQKIYIRILTISETVEEEKDDNDIAHVVIQQPQLLNFKHSMIYVFRLDFQPEATLTNTPTLIQLGE